jgi:hypothetical protein
LIRIPDTEGAEGRPRGLQGISTASIRASSKTSRTSSTTRTARASRRFTGSRWKGAIPATSRSAALTCGCRFRRRLPSRSSTSIRPPTGRNKNSQPQPPSPKSGWALAVGRCRSPIE